MIPAAPPAAGSSLGFTLTELALVILMTGVAVAVAASAYRTYAVRAQVTVGIRSAEPLQAAVASAYSSDGSFGDLQRLPGSRSDFVSSTAIVHGRIDLGYGGAADPAIAGRTLSLTPYETAALEIVWVCGNRIPGPGLKPLGFAAGGRRAEQIATTIEARYLPPSCR